MSRLLEFRRAVGKIHQTFESNLLLQDEELLQVLTPQLASKASICPRGERPPSDFCFLGSFRRFHTAILPEDAKGCPRAPMTEDTPGTVLGRQPCPEDVLGHQVSGNSRRCPRTPSVLGLKSCIPRRPVSGDSGDRLRMLLCLGHHFRPGVPGHRRPT